MNTEPLKGFVAMEGVDYSGKESHTELTKTRLERLGYSVLTMAFPAYESYSGKMITRYLNEEFGHIEALNPRLTAYLYEVDRALNGQEIRRHVKRGGKFIADRFTGSNMAHQGAKITDRHERRVFYETCMVSEFDALGVPRPAQSFVLLVGKEFMANTINGRLEQDDELDAHERNVAYQMKVIDAYEELCEIYPEMFIPIDCMANEYERRSFPDINDELFEMVKEVV